MPSKAEPPANSQAIDDYLKAILELGGAANAPVASHALAERLGVKTPSVTGMLQKLAARRQSFVLYEKHKGARLTAAGKKRAWELVRHHRLLELFLHDILKYSWDEVHEEAERLEHYISERFEDRIAALLGDPAIDPHGHFIPRKYEEGEFKDEVPLLRWPVGQRAAVSSVSDRDSAMLRELERLGLTPGVRVIVDGRNPGASLAIRLVGEKNAIRLSNDLASCLFVAGAE